MFCSECGMQLEEGALFCPNCGARVDEVQGNVENQDKTVVLNDEHDGQKENAESSEQGQAQDAENPEENVSLTESEGSDKSVNSAEVENPQENTDLAESENLQDNINPAEDESPKEDVSPAEAENPEKTETEETSPADTVVEKEAVAVPAGDYTQKKFCPNCGTANNINDLFCQECGMFFGSAEEKMAQGDTGKTKQKGKLKKVIPIVAAAAAAVVLCCIFLPRILSGIGSKSSERDFVLYIKDNELNMAKSSKFVPFLIGDRVFEDKNINYYIGNWVTCTPDNKYIYYPHKIEDYTFDLYRRELGDKNAKEEKIDSNVVNYQIIGSDKVAYIKDSTDRRLYLYEKGEAEKVASDVSWIDVSADDKYMLWMTYDDDGELYVQDTNLKENRIKLDSDIYYLYGYSDNFDTIVYDKDDNLYIIKNLGEKVKIASDVENAYVYGINDNLQIYYFKEGDEEGFTFYDLIEDDYLSADQKMKEPRIEDYQTVTYVNDFFGMRERIETSDSYYDDLDAYDRKLERDDLREELKNEFYGNTWEIYYYNVQKDENIKVMEVLEDQVFSIESPGTKTALMYILMYDFEGFFDGLKLSRLMEFDENEDEWEKRILENLQFTYIYDGEVLQMPFSDDLDLKDTDIEYGLLVHANEETHTMYLSFEFYDKDEIELYSYDYVTPDAEMELISDEVAEYPYHYDDKGMYYVNEDDELYCNEVKIDNDVYYESVRTQEDGKILYLTDINKDKNEGTLKMYQNGNITKISDDVAIFDYCIFDGNKIAYLADYNFNKSRGDLEVYNGKETIKVDTDVQSILFND